MPFLVLYKLFQISEATLQKLTAVFFHWFPDYFPQIQGVQRVEEHEGEIGHVATHKGAGVVGEL